VSSPHQNKEKVHINVHPQTISIPATAQQPDDPVLLDFYLWCT